MGDFLNEFAVKSFSEVALTAFFMLPIFGYFYNKWIDGLKGKEHTSIYVVIGVLATLIMGALFSWKSALLYSVLFALSGLPMIFGDYARSHRADQEEKTKDVDEKKLRRKRLPYSANGMIADAYDASKEASRLLGMALRSKNVEERALQIAEAIHEISIVSQKMVDLKLIQKGEE